MSICPTCTTELEELDALWLTCPDCKRCFPAQQDGAGDLRYDGIRDGFGPSNPFDDPHWQRTVRRQYGEDYSEPTLDEGW